MIANQSDIPNPTRASRLATLPVEAVMIFGGIAVALAGLLLPWVTVVAPFVGPIARTGADTADGRTIGFLLLALCLVALREHLAPGRWLRLGLILGLGTVAALVYVDHQDTVRRMADMSTGLATGGVGTGLYLSGFGTLIAAGGALQRTATFRARTLADRLPAERLAARRALVGKAGFALFGLTLFTVTLVGGSR